MNRSGSEQVPAWGAPDATAFSPTDVLPLSRWAKLTVAAQAGVSLVVVVLVVARAINALA